MNKSYSTVGCNVIQLTGCKPIVELRSQLTGHNIVHIIENDQKIKQPIAHIKNVGVCVVCFYCIMT